MNFSNLPTCIRQEIIQRTVEAEPEYSSVSKEWLKCTVSEFGALRFLDYRLSDIDESNSTKLCTPYITKVWIGRCDNIHWDLIYNIRDIREITIDFTDEKDINTCDETLTKLMPLSSLESIFFYSELNISARLGQLLKKNQHCLKSLYIVSECIPYRLFVEYVKLPNLTRLTLSGNSHYISISNIANNFPRLEYLSLDLNSYDGTIFDSFEMPNLTFLGLKSYNFDDKIIKLSLTSIPRLKGLDIDNGFELESSTLEDMRIFGLGGIFKSMKKVLKNQFTNLNRLIIRTYHRDHELDWVLFNNSKLPNLKYLEFEWYEGTGIDDKMIHFFDGFVNDTVEDLSIPGYTNDLAHILRHSFTNLRRVHLHLHEQSCDDDMNELFQCFRNLTELSLSFHLRSDLLQALPPGPYSITHLSFEGLFILTSPLLTWFSHHLPHLTTLSLHWYHFRGELPSAPLIFPDLCYLVIHTPSKYRTLIEAHFNTKNYPDIKLAFLKCSCYCCDILTKYDIDYLWERPTSNSS